MLDAVIDAMGWSGSLMLIFAYYQNSRNKLNAQSASYQWLNVLGSVLLIINTLHYGAYPSSVVNVVWVVIGIHYLMKIRKNAAIH